MQPDWKTETNRCNRISIRCNRIENWCNLIWNRCNLISIWSNRMRFLITNGVTGLNNIVTGYVLMFFLLDKTITFFNDNWELIKTVSISNCNTLKVYYLCKSLSISYQNIFILNYRLLSLKCGQFTQFFYVLKSKASKI